MRSRILPSFVLTMRRMLASVPSTTYSRSPLTNTPHGVLKWFHCLRNFPFLIEHLHALVAAIADVEAAVRIDRDAVRLVELSGLGAFAAPPRQKRAVFRIFHDARVGA